MVAGWRRNIRLPSFLIGAHSSVPGTNADGFTASVLEVSGFECNIQENNKWTIDVIAISLSSEELLTSPRKSSWLKLKITYLKKR